MRSRPDPESGLRWFCLPIDSFVFLSSWEIHPSIWPHPSKMADLGGGVSGSESGSNFVCVNPGQTKLAMASILISIWMSQAPEVARAFISDLSRFSDAVPAGVPRSPQHHVQDDQHRQLHPPAQPLRLPEVERRALCGDHARHARGARVPGESHRCGSRRNSQDISQFLKTVCPHPPPPPQFVTIWNKLFTFVSKPTLYVRWVPGRTNTANRKICPGLRSEPGVTPSLPPWIHRSRDGSGDCPPGADSTLKISTHETSKVWGKYSCGGGQFGSTQDHLGGLE